MGWAVGFDSNLERWIGYGVPAQCDHPGCKEEIDRGLAYVCGGQPYGGDRGCGLHFCDKHGGGGLCERCQNEQEPFEPKPDVEEWIQWQLTDESWEKWRKDNNVHRKGR